MNIDPTRLPLGIRVPIHVCMRDSEAQDERQLYAVNVTDGNGDTVLRLIADDIEEGHEASTHNDGLRVWLVVGHHSTPLSDFTYYVGNIAWDAGWCSRSEAIDLIQNLLELGFHVEECVEDAVVT